MKCVRLMGSVVVCAAIFAAQSATALYVDDKSMNSDNATAKFSDPDEKSPVFLQGGTNNAAGSVDPSSVQYDYDASTGNYVPRKAHAQ